MNSDWSMSAFYFYFKILIDMLYLIWSTQEWFSGGNMFRVNLKFCIRYQTSGNMPHWERSLKKLPRLCFKYGKIIWYVKKCVHVCEPLSCVIIWCDLLNIALTSTFIFTLILLSIIPHKECKVLNQVQYKTMALSTITFSWLRYWFIITRLSFDVKKTALCKIFIN